MEKPIYFLIFAFSLQLGCSDKNELQESFYSITGYVRLTTTTRNAAAESTGTLAIDNATGIRVYLVQNGLTIDMSTTINGKYTFDHLSSGTYRVKTWVIPSLIDSTALIFLDTKKNVIANDTLELCSSAGIIAYPNPFAILTTINYSLASMDSVNVCIVTLDLTQRVKTLIAGVHHPGKYAVVWNGTLSDGSTLASDGAYWVIFSRSDSSLTYGSIQSPPGVGDPYEFDGSSIYENQLLIKGVMHPTEVN